MILYHGSSLEVARPDILHSRKNVDFGPGFYLTPLRIQAENWCKKFIRRNGYAYLSIYVLDDEAFRKCNILNFSSYSDEWLDFVTTCRKGRDASGYDIVMGGVANDKVFDTVELFFEGLIDKKEAIRHLRYEKPNMQICIRTQDAIDHYLLFQESERIEGGGKE